jgi:hypothetical protein
VIDVGGESTRPGAEAVDIATELDRVVPVVEALARRYGCRSTPPRPRWPGRRGPAGATLINDVSASLWPVAAELGVGWVAMHRRGTPATMQSLADYDDVVAEVTSELVEAADRATAAGVEEVWIDPGIGFAKTAEHNLRLLAHLDHLVATGYPVLVGTSRKASSVRPTPTPTVPGWARARAACGPVSTWRSPTTGVAEPVPPDDRPRGQRRHGDVEPCQGCEDGTGARCAPARTRCRWPARCPPAEGTAPTTRRRRSDGHEGQMGTRDHPTALLVDHQGQAGDLRAARGLRHNHRKVRRQEEIIWIREQGFTRVVSLIPSPHNLHNYDELGVEWVHCPFAGHDDPSRVLGALPADEGDARAGGKLLLHGEELGDRVCGVAGGYLLWTGLIKTGPDTITATEQLTSRQLGPAGP